MARILATSRRLYIFFQPKAASSQVRSSSGQVFDALATPPAHEYTSAQTSTRLGVSASGELGVDGEFESGSAPFEGTLVGSHAWSSREEIEATIGPFAWNGGG